MVEQLTYPCAVKDIKTKDQYKGIDRTRAYLILTCFFSQFYKIRMDNLLKLCVSHGSLVHLIGSWPVPQRLLVRVRLWSHDVLCSVLRQDTLPALS